MRIGSTFLLSERLTFSVFTQLSPNSYVSILLVCGLWGSLLLISSQLLRRQTVPPPLESSNTTKIQRHFHLCK